MRICRYMLHLSIARAIASDIRTVVQFLEQNQFIRQSCRRSMSGLSGQFKNVRFSRRSRFVRFAPKADKRTRALLCPLSANSDRTQRSKKSLLDPSARPRDFAGTLWKSAVTADHSGLMLAARITFAHVSVYSATKLPNSADELANGSSPKSRSRALNVGSARAALTCLLRIAMISGAAFAGAPSPTQPAAS